MRDYEEKSYYEIQLDNKQLILVFLAGVTVCVLVFILGVMVGKGRKEAEIAAIGKTEQKVVRPEPDLTPPQEIQQMKPAAIKSEAKKQEAKKENSKENTQDDPAYYELDTDKEKPLEKEPAKTEKKGTTVASKETEKKTTENKKAETAKAEKSQPEVPKAETPKAELAKAEAEPKSGQGGPAPQSESEEQTVPEPTLKEGGRYTVQVMATSSKSKAEEQLSTLQANGYTAFMKEEKAGDTSVFKVRVGRFSDKDSAKKIATKLKQELRLESWVANLD